LVRKAWLQRSWYSHSSGFAGFVAIPRDKAEAGQ
jgi:hypothetical protein